jgi:peptide deformylase
MTISAQSNRDWRAGQAHPDIVLIGDPALRRGAEQVTDFGDMPRLFDRLVALLRALNGAGLAAPQIGVAWAAIVVEVRKTDVFPDRPESSLMQMVNPTIGKSSEEEEPGWEGCFSVPGLMGIVDRPRLIEVSYCEPDGTPRSGAFDGYVARVIQHEIDHLRGITFLDRMTSMQSITTVTNYTKYHAAKQEKPT